MIKFVSMYVLFSLCYCQNSSSKNEFVNPTSSMDFDVISFAESMTVDITTFSTSSVVQASAVVTSSLFPLTSNTLSTAVVTSVSPSPTGIDLLSLTDLFSSQSVTSCSCDLLIKSCDVDCCCDIDCSYSHLAAFSLCPNEDVSVVARCISKSFLFRSSLFTSESSSLFCVYFDNYQGDLKFPTVFIATDIVEINRQLALYSRTGDVLALFPSLYTSSNNQFYHSGDLITVLYDTNVTGYMTIPAPLAGDLCQDSNPVTYLNDMSTTCYRYLSSDGSECSRSSLFNAQNYYANFTLSNIPQISSNSSVPIKLGNVNCFDVSGRLVSCDSTSLLPVYNTSLLVCNNALLQISYKFYHNGSAGIIMAFVDIDIGQVDSHRIKQVFSVQFLSLESNTTINTFKRSGNPGYIDGEPVIVGNYDVNNIHGVIADWLTIMNVGKNGNCNERYSVTFKDNIKTFCTLRIQSSVIKSGCYDLDTLSLFFGNFQFNRVAIYGNSDPSNASQWVDVFTDKPVTMGCSSVVTGVQILVFYSYSGSVHSPHTLITGVHMQYITQNISDKCIGQACSFDSNVTILLQSAVIFVPAYSVPAESLRSIAVTGRALPEDFFYPVLFSGGNSNYNTIITCAFQGVMFVAAIFVLIIIT